MKIGIFGGSFNPIHIGHLKIAEQAIKQLNLDKLFFVPANINPFKKDIKMVESFHRVNMIKLVLKDKMEISSFEIDRKGVSYTIDTIKYFKNKFKNDEIFLLIGSDNLAKLPKWRDIDQISALAKIAVFKRDKNINKTNIKKYNCQLLNNEIYQHSSTRFLNGNFFDVENDVRFYIGKNKLYFQKILENTLTQQRYLHSLHARDYALEISKILNYDIDKASFSAMVHDIAKQISEDDSRKLIARFEKDKKDIPKYMLHQETGYVILKHIFGIDDDISNSVRVHTSLSLDLNMLDKIVFMADKLCQGRKWEGIQKIRNLAKKDFEQAFKLVVKRTREFNLAKGITLTKEQEEIYSKWEK